MRSPFDQWLLDNYGFEADFVPTKLRPPEFIRDDDWFDMVAYEKWVEDKRKEFESGTTD